LQDHKATTSGSDPRGGTGGVAPAKIFSVDMQGFCVEIQARAFPTVSGGKELEEI
jgi:hypothetical protein